MASSAQSLKTIAWKLSLKITKAGKDELVEEGDFDEADKQNMITLSSR